MTTRPRARATLLSALVTSVAPRLVKKLDRNPREADAWEWRAEPGAVTVTTDAGDRVRLVVDGGVVASLEGGACTCLLSPRCFHLLAVVAALEIDEVAGALPEGAVPSKAAPRSAGVVAVSDAERAAARAAWEAAAHVVAGGGSAAGAVVQGELLRAAHAARALGLYRVASAAVRVVRAVRALREERPEFALGELSLDLDDLLASSWAIAHGEAPVEEAWIGVARRAYEPLGGLRLTGLFTEPILGAGYAGVISYACDDRGRIFTLHDVMPAEASRARSAYDAAAKMGDTSVTHRALVRGGLFMQDATASRDMRLGAGAGVKAVRAGATTLDDGAPAALWDEPIAAQIARAYEALLSPVPERPAAATLLFTRVTVVGREGAALVVTATRPDGEPLLLRVVAPSDHSELSYRDNLRLLASAPGLRLRVAGHVVHDRPRTLTGIAAVAGVPEGDAPALALPPEWGGRVCLGLDRLQSAHLVGARGDREVTLAGLDALDPLEPLRRRVQRMALGGRGTLGPSAMRAIEHERAGFQKRHMPTAGAVLDALARAALGERHRVALAWLGASTYDREAMRALRRAAWMG